MDSFEFNKIAGGVLAALLVVVGLRIIGESVYSVEPLEKSAYEVPGVEAEAPAGAEQAAKPVGPSFEEALAKADMSKGETISNKCKTCHTIVKDGPNKIGPDLWGVVGRPVATHGGFNYSDSLKKIGGDWTFEKIEHFITKPRDFAPGTKMTFPGLPNVQDRADIIAYLNTQSDSPLPLPKPEAKPAAAPAEGGEAKPAASEKAAPAATPDNGAAGGNGAGSQTQPTENAAPAPATTAPKGAGHDQNEAKPEEQQETQPAH
jgi:cytochrome c